MEKNARGKISLPSRTFAQTNSWEGISIYSKAPGVIPLGSKALIYAEWEAHK